MSSTDRHFARWVNRSRVFFHDFPGDRPLAGESALDATRVHETIIIPGTLQQARFPIDFGLYHFVQVDT